MNPEDDDIHSSAAAWACIFGFGSLGLFGLANGAVWVIEKLLG